MVFLLSKFRAPGIPGWGIGIQMIRADMMGKAWTDWFGD